MTFKYVFPFKLNHSLHCTLKYECMSCRAFHKYNTSNQDLLKTKFVKHSVKGILLTYLGLMTLNWEKTFYEKILILLQACVVLNDKKSLISIDVFLSKVYVLFTLCFIFVSLK